MKQNKRDLILDAMQALMSEDLASNASISDVAQRAGIAKGGIYYYFRSKDEILDAVLERSYAQSIAESWSLVQSTDLNALAKMEILFLLFLSPSATVKQHEMLKYLHLQNDIVLHQKFLALTIHELTPILSDILKQGVAECMFTCPYPNQLSEIILSMLVVLFDHTIVPCEDNLETLQNKLKALALILEKTLGLPPESCSYFYTSPTFYQLAITNASSST